MKTIYQVLSKEEKQKVKQEFKEKKATQVTRLIRLILIGTGAGIYSFINIIIEVFKDKPNIYFIGLCVLCLAAGIFFIFEAFVIRLKEYNKIAKKNYKNK